jgi:ankyrin repeat protein
MQNGVDLESKDKDSWTPLSLAVGRGREAVVRLLLVKGIDVEAKTDSGRTALQVAGQAVVRLLISAPPASKTGGPLSVSV